MLNGLLRVHKDYQIVLKPINTDFATNAIEYCFEDFSKHIPYIWAHKGHFYTIDRKMETTRTTTGKF